MTMLDPVGGLAWSVIAERLRKQFVDSPMSPLLDKLFGNGTVEPTEKDLLMAILAVLSVEAGPEAQPVKDAAATLTRYYQDIICIGGFKSTKVLFTGDNLAVQIDSDILPTFTRTLTANTYNEFDYPPGTRVRIAPTEPAARDRVDVAVRYTT